VRGVGCGGWGWKLGTVMDVRAATIHLCSQLIVKDQDSCIKGSLCQAPSRLSHCQAPRFLQAVAKLRFRVNTLSHTQER